MALKLEFIGPKAQQPFASSFNFLPKNFNFVNIHDPGYLSVPQSGINNRMLYSPRYEGFGGKFTAFSY